MEQAVRALFDRYAAFAARALAGTAAPGEGAELYAAEFIAAGPMGVMAGQNDAAFARRLADGFARYRAIGTRAMRIRALRITPIDGLHAVAHVGWTAVHARDDLPETAIDFEVHYLVQVTGGTARVFGWIAGDEDAVLRERGIV